MKYGIQLSSGRDIFLAALNQSHTYAGLLEGVPHKEMNQRIVEYALQGARKLWPGTPYLIPPVESPIALGHEYPFGTPASIPGIICSARFKSFSAARDGDMDYSELSFVWFQPAFALPIDEQILAAIGSTDWDAHAMDFQF